MKQNSAEWHKMRKGKIGASDANIIMGVSKFMTPFQLWEQKTSDEIKEDEPNFIQRKGHDLEERSRAIFETETGHEWPPIIAVHEKKDYIMASLDGFCKELDVIWESKYVGQDDFNIVKDGDCLYQYYPQIQQQLFVTGARYLVLDVTTEDKDKEKGSFKNARLDIYPDSKYIKSKLLPHLNTFWEKVTTKTPPVLAKMDVLKVKDKELLKLLAEYKTAKASAEKEKELKTKIFKMISHNKVECGNFKISVSVSEGSESIDYKKICETLLNPEIFNNYITKKKGRKTQIIKELENDKI